MNKIILIFSICAVITYAYSNLELSEDALERDIVSHNKVASIGKKYRVKDRIKSQEKWKRRNTFRNKGSFKVNYGKHSYKQMRKNPTIKKK